MPQTETEKATPIVRKLIRRLKAAGYTRVSVDDGMGHVRTKTEKAAVEAITAVDVARARFVNPTTKDEGTVLLVVSNGVEVISDYSYTEGKPFSILVDAVCTEVEDLLDQ